MGHLALGPNMYAYNMTYTIIFNLHVTLWLIDRLKSWSISSKRGQTHTSQGSVCSVKNIERATGKYSVYAACSKYRSIFRFISYGNTETKQTLWPSSIWKFNLALLNLLQLSKNLHLWSNSAFLTKSVCQWIPKTNNCNFQALIPTNNKEIASNTIWKTVIMWI